MRTHADYRSETAGKLDSVIMFANVRQNLKKMKGEDTDLMLCIYSLQWRCSVKVNVTQGWPGAARLCCHW